VSSGTTDGPHQDALIDELFDRALDLPRGERSAFLDAECAGDEELRARVERLLGYSDDPPSILDDTPATELFRSAAPVIEPVMPERVGPYRILEEIGRGGMGVVYLGDRADGHFEQQVAIKLMRPGADNTEARSRFQQERQIIASLHHRSIARLYDGGVTEEGQPYSAMEFVEGTPINVYCDENRLGIAERLRLVEVVAGAVHHAHQNLVVHCDLKPSNILVTPEGEIRLLDFGIARLLDTATTGAPSEGQLWSRAITPRYASPEQIRDEPVTTASDIYQLGLLLFELLTGERARDISSTSDVTEVTELAGQPPIPPSAALRDLSHDRAVVAAGARNTQRRSLLRSLRKDLDLVVQTALAPKPEERYPSAAALLEDLERYRRSEPLAVGPATLRYRVGRFVRRNRLAVAVAATLISLLLGYSVTVTLQAEKIRRERDRAQRMQTFALGIYGADDPVQALGPEVSAADLVTRGVARAEAELSEEPDLQAEVKLYLGRAYTHLGLYEAAETQYRDTLALREGLYGEAHPEVAEALHHLASVLLKRDAPQALPLLEKALAQNRRFLGDDHPSNARVLANIGHFLRSAGRYGQAEERFREALDLQRRHDPDGIAVAGTLAGLAWSVRVQSRPQEAELLLQEALTIRRTHFGDRHPQVASNWNDLATVLWQLERWEEGDKAIRQAIELRKELQGDTHPSIALSLGNLAGALFRRGEVKRAAELYRQVVDMREEGLGSNHPRLAQSKTQLAEVLHETGDLDEALKLFESSLAIFKDHLPPDHPSFGRVCLGLGKALIDADQLERARSVLDRARPIYVEMKSPVWPRRVDVLLASIDRRQGRLEEARDRLLGAEGNLGNGTAWQERWRRETELLEAEMAARN